MAVFCPALLDGLHKFSAVGFRDFGVMTHGSKCGADAIPGALYFPLTRQVVQHANLVVTVTGWVDSTLSVCHGQLSADATAGAARLWGADRGTTIGL